MLPSYQQPHQRCTQCRHWFKPKRGGYNALYCSRKCKARAATKRPHIRRQRLATSKRSYQRIRLHPERYAQHLRNGRKTQKGIRGWLAEYKLKRGCKDCGYRAHYAALQLDHEGKKSAHIADIRSSVRRLLKEIKTGKCVVRCGNCHAVKTWCEKNGLKYRVKRKRDT